VQYFRVEGPSDQSCKAARLEMGLTNFDPLGKRARQFGSNIFAEGFSFHDFISLSFPLARESH
jgi:hypothetical protein